MANTSSRQVVLRALREWDETARHADDILADLRADPGLTFAPQDWAFVQNLFYGVLRHLSALDGLIAQLRDGKLSHENRQILRIGLYQLFFTRIPAHAAVNETVSLARSGRAVVNGVLRSAGRRMEELGAWLAAQPMSVRESHPQFLLDRWTAALGSETTEALCRWNNETPPVYVRRNSLINGLSTMPESAGENLTALDAPGLEGFYEVTGSLPLELLQSGHLYAQDPSTAVSCRLLDARPGETVIDACAAPGGKCAYLAAAMENQGRIIAAEVSAPRLRQLQENLERLNVRNVTVSQRDWLKAGKEAFPLAPGTADAILVDVPCSNTGVMRRRVDVRWRLEPRVFEEMPRLQEEIAAACLPYLKPGGRLVYSTCSLEREENEDVVARLLEADPRLKLEETAVVRPWEDGFDGAFAARLRLGD